MVDFLLNSCRFFSHESCGQCTPCRVGTHQLLDLAEQMNLRQAIEALFEGRPVNASESRPALHTALRRPVGDKVLVKVIEIDEDAIRLLARAPKPTPLRFITTALKLVTDLERIGDMAVNVCERVRVLLSVMSSGAILCGRNGGARKRVFGSLCGISGSQSGMWKG